MSKIETVLIVPPDFSGAVDPAVDRIEEDPDVDSPKVTQVKVPESGDTSVDRAFVNDERKILIKSAIEDYQKESDKDSPNIQTQLDALERAVSFMWDVVSGEDVGSEAERTAEAETNDSTSA